MIEKLRAAADRHAEIEGLISDPEIMKDLDRYRALVQEHSRLQETVDAYHRYERLTSDIADARQLLEEEDDIELTQLATEELETLEGQIEQLTEDLRALLVPKDPLDLKNIIMEIRAGTGGEEAALFAADLYRMYVKYAEGQGWKTEIMTQHATGLGGFKEIILLVQGRGAFSRMRYESGVHRVQRIPETESQGRIHTSAVTVAVLPEAEDVEVAIDPNHLRIDVFRSSGPGGQSVNTTDSAVRITHTPTGLVVSCQDEKSQHKNKAKAMRVLKARLLDRLISEQQSKISEERKLQVGSGDRSQRIRTYNFPQGRISDHRIGLTLYKLQGAMEGDLDPIIDPLVTHFQSEALKQVATEP